MAPEQDQEDFVYDYLYLDKAKLSYFLAQLDDNGVAATAKTVQSITGINSGEIKGSLKIAAASVKGEEGHSSASELNFDASWMLPSNVLAVLDDHSLLHRGLTDNIGQIVLVSGELRMFDIELVKRLWDGIVAFMAHEQAPTKNPKAASAENKKMQIAGKIVKDLPAALQFSLLTHDGDEIWSQLESKSMTVDPHGMTLKHGPSIQGEWHVVAVVDAVPGASPFERGQTTSQFMEMMGPLMGGLQTIIGRPHAAYGVTPLMIFRKCH